jgi:hypothetical protein
MKKIIVAIAIALISITTSNAQEKKVQWPEWTTFHGVMSGTFHPAEEGNLEPIRTRSEEMVTKAEAWLKSTAPKEFDKPKVKELLVLLVKESKELDVMVKAKASDEELTKALTALHDRFHSIVGACKNEDEHDHKGHGHEGHKH